MALIAGRMKKMQKKHAQKTFEGVGVSLPGRFDPESQRMIFAPNLRWPPYDIKKALERGMGMKVELGNAASACLLSEMWFGCMDGVRNAVLVTISEGIGTGVLANGQLVSGMHGMAGEFGHIPLDPSGPQCACGGTGCWQTLASSSAALRYYAELSRAAQPITMQDLIKLAEEGDACASEALKRQALQIGRGMRTILAALSPEVILITGDITSAWPRVSPIIEEEVRTQVLAGTPPHLVPVDESEVARLRSAAALVLQNHTSGHRSRKAGIRKPGREHRRRRNVAGGVCATPFARKSTWLPHRWKHLDTAYSLQCRSAPRRYVATYRQARRSGARSVRLQQDRSSQRQRNRPNLGSSNEAIAPQIIDSRSNLDLTFSFVRPSAGAPPAR